MAIYIYNTLSRKKEPLQTLEHNHVKLYVCGITSYDYCHIGHARSVLAFDMIVRYLRYSNYKVTYVRNLTDIDDKIIARAHEQNIPAKELAEQFIDAFNADMDSLGVDHPDVEPRATDHIKEMIDIITGLIEKNKAYQVNSDVYYSVDTFPEYGKLGKRDIYNTQTYGRISANQRKKNPLDFVLWKGSKPGEPTWESPWGPGRPGWHIECSSMSRKYLGETFDIHGGGQDLIFPHHENEIAQSEGASGKPFVKTWIHHGFVTISNEKMSKSLGNFLTIRHILSRYHPEILRFFIFSTHYRNPLEFSEDAMRNAGIGLKRLYTCIATVDALKSKNMAQATKTVMIDRDIKKIAELEPRFVAAMDNDFNTAQAQGIFFDTAKTINRIYQRLATVPATDDIQTLKDAVATLKRLAGIMGILQEDARQFLDARKNETIANHALDTAAIKTLIDERHQCRLEKNWSQSDAIRDELLAKNIVLEDGPRGTTWSTKSG